MRISIVIFLLVSSMVSAQEKYHIIHIKSEIYLKSTGELLKPRDVLSPNDEITFGSKDAMAAVISSSKGRFIIKLDKVQNTNSELTAAVKNALFESSGKLSTRSSLNTMYELQHYLTGKHVFLGDSAFLLINRAVMPMNDSQFFFLRYQYKEESINKKLNFIGDKLLFLSNDIFQIDGKKINKNEVSDFQLYYYKADEKQSNLVNSFDMIFLNNNSHKEELLIINTVVKNLTKEEQQDHLVGYLTDVYGKVYMPSFEEWTNKHIYR